MLGFQEMQKNKKRDVKDENLFEFATLIEKCTHVKGTKKCFA